MARQEKVAPPGYQANTHPVYPGPVFEDGQNAQLVQNLNIGTTSAKKPKEEWSNKIEYMLSCVSYGVGLGNLWRFPYLCFEHKGFTFLIPYFICLFCCGVPLCILEGCLGQFTGAGAITVWRMAPIFEGVGWGEMAMSGLCCVYYNVIVAYALYYLVVSLPFYGTWTLPYDDRSEYCQTWRDSLVNITTEANTTTISCAENYYNTEILKDTGEYLEGLGTINWPLVGTLALAWALIYWSQSQGTKTTGKLSYVTALLPYFCLTALFIGTIRLKGAYSVGIVRYATIDWSYLAGIKVWKAAAQQVFFSQGAAWGVLINFAAHNPYRMNVFSKSWQLSLINAATSFYGGFVVFSTLGFLAMKENNDDLVLATANFENVVKQTHKLAFVVYPVAITQMPIPMFWAVLFFVMLSTLGIGSQVGMFMGVYEGCREKFKVLQRHPTRFLVVCVVVQVILAYPMLTGAGIQWLNVFDWSICALSIFIFGFLETLAVSYIYGIVRFVDDIEGMLGFKLPCRFLWIFAWSVVTPCFCLALIIINIVGYFQPENGNQMWNIGGTWPTYVNVIGWTLQLIQIVPIVAFAIFNPRFGMKESHYRNRNEQLNKEEKQHLVGNNSSGTSGSSCSMTKDKERF